MIGLSWRVATATRKGKVVAKRKQLFGRVIPQAQAQVIEDFRLSPDVSRPLPLKNRIKLNTVTYLLETSYTGAFKLFQQKHPDIKVKYVKFVQTKPSHVRHMKALERIVCCCIKCENIKQQVKALNVCANKAPSPHTCRCQGYFKPNSLSI